MFVSFKLRKERDMARIQALLDLSNYSLKAMYISLFLLLAAGVTAGFMGHHWGKGWIWASFGILKGMTVAIYAFATPYYARVRKAAGLPYFQGFRGRPAEPAASPEELAGLLRSFWPHLIAGLGVGGLLVILWLMMFKPF